VEKKLRSSILKVLFGLVGFSAFAIAALGYPFLKLVGIVPEGTIFYDGNWTIGWGMSVIMAVLVSISVVGLYTVSKREERTNAS